MANPRDFKGINWKQVLICRFPGMKIEEMRELTKTVRYQYFWFNGEVHKV